MTYELLAKGSNCFVINQVRIKEKAIAFSHNFDNFFSKSFVYVYIDKDENKIAFEPTDDRGKGYKLLKGKKSYAIALVIRNFSGKVGQYIGAITPKGLLEIKDCLDVVSAETVMKIRGGRSGQRIMGDAISVSKTAITFSRDFDEKIKNYDRVEFFKKQGFTDKDIIILKPTRNKIDGRKLQRKNGSTYTPQRTEDYVVGVYPIKTTSEGFVVEILKKKY